MRKLSKILLAVTLTSGLMFGGNIGYQYYSSLSKLQAKESVKQSLVKVEGEYGYGSGVIIKSNEHGSLILTNKHVCMINKLKDDDLKKSHEIPEYSIFNIKKIYEDNSKEYNMIGQVLKVGKNSDLCLIHANKGNQPTSELANNEAKWGDTLYGFSNPRGFEAIFSEGIAQDLMYIWNMQYRQATVLAQPGSSGSGVFNEEGELVGLISLTDGWYSYYVPHSHIKAFIAEFL